MRLWLIAGSSSGVGKTTLAEKLVEILPGSVHVKLGHGQVKSGKAPNFFTSTEKAFEFIKREEDNFDHCIIESTRLVGKIKTDVVIFLESRDFEPRSDSDVLESKADIILGKSSNAHEWRDKLGHLELPVGILKRIIRILEAQDEFLAGSRLVLKSKIWFTKDGLTVFGEGIARLLRAIETHGSLSAAARFEGVSYRHAWGDLKKAEERLGFKLVERHAGGKSGGTAKLTPKAKNLLKGYEQFKHRINHENQKWFEKFNKEII